MPLTHAVRRSTLGARLPDIRNYRFLTVLAAVAFVTVAPSRISITAF